MRMKERELTFFLFTLGPVLLFTVFFIGPTVATLILSFTDYTGLSFDVTFVGLRNYVKLFKDSLFWNATRTTYTFTLSYTLLRIIVSVILALGLNSIVRGGNLFRALFFFPAMIAMITVGLIWRELYHTLIPSIARALRLGILNESVLGNQHTAIWGVVFVAIWRGAAIPIVVFLGTLQGIPNELSDAATIDGVNALQRHRYISLPFLLPVIVIFITLGIREGLYTFDYIMAMTGGGPGFATTTYGYSIYFSFFRDYNAGFATSQAMVLVAEVLLVSILLLRFFRKYQVEADS